MAYIFPWNVQASWLCRHHTQTLRWCKGIPTAQGFWLFTFIVNMNHASSHKNVSSFMFYFCPALDLSVAFSTALYIVGPGWLSIVITLQDEWYGVRFSTWERGFSLQNGQTGKVKNVCSYTSASSVCLHGIDIENFTHTFLVVLFYMLLLMWDILYKPLIILWHLLCESMQMKLEYPLEYY